MNNRTMTQQELKDKEMREEISNIRKVVYALLFINFVTAIIVLDIGGFF